MAQIEDNQFQTIADNIGNIYIIIFFIILTVASILSSIYTNLNFVPAVFCTLLLTVSVASRIKIRNRYLIEFGYYATIQKLTKKSENSKERVIIGEYVEYKNQFILAYNFDFLDLSSLPKKSDDKFQEVPSQNDIQAIYSNFLNQLPAGVDIEILTKKEKPTNPEQNKKLGIEIGSYAESFVINYYLILKLDKKQIEKSTNIIREIFSREITLLTPFETLKLLK